MEFNTWSILLVAIASFILGLAAYIFGKEKTNLTLTWLSLAIAVWCFAQFMGAVVAGREAVLFWTRLNLAAAVLIPVSFLWFALAFTGELAREKKLLALAWFAAAVFLGLDLTRYFVADVAPVFDLRYYPVPGVVYPYFGLYVLIFFGLGFVKLFNYLRSCRGEKRNQADYVFLASVIGFVGGMTAFFPILNLNLPVISHYFMPIYLALMLYAIVKHKLLDINVVIFQGLVYSALTVLFTVFYALGLVFFSRYFSRHADNWSALLAVVFASVLVFQPLRDLIQKFIDRLFFRGEFYYRQKISDLSTENQTLFQRLQQADKLASLGTIAAGMAHEIKNPLAAIKGLTQVLPENLKDREFIRDYAEVVPRQLDRINKLVDDLLAFGRPAKMIFREQDLARLLSDTFKLLAKECQQKGIKVRLELIPALIEADAGHLGQAILNVSLNAIQAMPDGGELAVRLSGGGETVTIEIADTGEGIVPEKLPHVFDPFFTTKGTGTGMGLAVTYRIIKDHGGEITADSRLGEGTTFKICLPIKQKRSA